MEPSRMLQRPSQTPGVRQLPGERQCLVALVQRFVHKAQMSQGVSRIGTAYHPQIMPILRGQGAMVLGGIECHRVL